MNYFFLKKVQVHDFFLKETINSHNVIIVYFLAGVIGRNVAGWPAAKSLSTLAY